MWKETPAADEDQRFERYAEMLASLQRNHGGTGRALHHKGHGIFEASLVVGDVPEQARHGLFAKPGTYEALVRYSNGAGRVQADKVADVRGLAVKVLGVDGDKVLGDAKTQDFLAVLSPATPFRTADEFVKIVYAARTPALAPFRVVGALGFRGLSIVAKLVKGLKMPPASLATKTFYSALPIQCGPNAVRFRFAPKAADAGSVSASEHFHAEELADRLRRGPIDYDLDLQFFVDETKTPIEDGSVDWDAPYVTVARLTIAKQDPTSERGKKLTARGERLAFDPWHALVTHKPLGGMMRARKHAYFASTKGRGGAAAEPTSIDSLLA